MTTIWARVIRPAGRPQPKERRGRPKERRGRPKERRGRPPYAGAGQYGARSCRLSTLPDPVFGSSSAKLTDLGTL